MNLQPGDLLILVLAACLAWGLILTVVLIDHHLGRHARNDWPVLDQWEADTEASIAEAIALTSDTPIHDELAVAQFRRDLDQWGTA